MCMQMYASNQNQSVYLFQLGRLCSQNSLVRVISRGFQSVGRLVSLLFLEIFGILEGT